MIEDGAMIRGHGGGRTFTASYMSLILFAAAANVETDIRICERVHIVAGVMRVPEIRTLIVNNPPPPI